MERFYLHPEPRLKVHPKCLRFFVEHAGYVVGMKALGAFRLARAEIEAGERGWNVQWEDDPDGFHDHKDWCPPFARKGRCNGHEVLCAVLRDEGGSVLAVLGGIIDPDHSYSRVVEAELFLEALSDIEIAALNDAESSTYLAL